MPQEEEPEMIAQGSAPRARRRRGRRVLLPAAALILIIAAYGGFWYYMAGRAAESLAAFIGQAEKNGVTVRCADLRKSGFPLRLDLACSALDAEGGGRREAAPLAKSADNAGESGAGALPQAKGSSAFAVHSGFVTAGAPVYAPHWISLEIGAPATLKLPVLKAIEADWQRLQCEGDFTARHPRTMALAVEKPLLRNLPFIGEKAPLSADFIRFDSKEQAGGMAAFTLSFDDLSAPLSLKGQEIMLPKADGTVDIILHNADKFYADLPHFIQSGDKAALRGREGLIQKAVLAFADGGGFTLSGPFSVAENGKLSGAITIAVNNPPALLRTIRAVFPNQASNAESLFFMLNAMPKNAAGEPQLTLDIKDGHMRMGFLRLGKIPPL